MKAYLKEILFSLAALFVMGLAIWAYLRSMQDRQTTVASDVYRLIPADADGLLVVNRPSVFKTMILDRRSLYQAFVSKIPPVFLAFVREHPEMPSATLSFHPQGVVCYLPVGNQADAIVRSMDKAFGAYEPLMQTKEGVDYYYYAEAGGRFFGYFVQQGVVVGSYSRKLLEKVAARQAMAGTALPDEVQAMCRAFDVNAPLNVIFPIADLNLYVARGEGLPAWHVTGKWLWADLFLSEGNFCCYGSLPYEAELTPELYRSMGDTIAGRVAALYPQVKLSFQTDRDSDRVYYTGCAPIR